MDFVFAYGHNMDLESLRGWLGENGYDPSGIKGCRPAVLRGYALVWNYHSCRGRGGAANIEPSPGGEVWGALIELEEGLLRALDHRENSPAAYYRGNRRLAVSVPGEREVEAWVYIARPNSGTRRDVWPTRAYRDLMLRGARSAGLPPAYLEELERIPIKD